MSSFYYLRLKKNPNLMYEIHHRNAPQHKKSNKNNDSSNDGGNNGEDGQVKVNNDRDVTKNGGSNNDEDNNNEEEDEKVNIGFGTDPSWFHQNQKILKTDLLHTGNRRGGKLLIAMVGLPGSGKTFMSRKISRFLRWISYRTRVYSLAKYRLEKYGAMNADFFDPRNEAHSQTRVKIFITIKLYLL